MLKKIFVSLVIIVIMIIAAIYIYRHTIIQYYATKIIRENLPPYIKIDDIKFDFANNRISFVNFKILNPPGFSSGYSLKIGDISCRYSIKGPTIPKSLEIMDVSFKGAVLEVERLKDSRINILVMEDFIKNTPAKRVESTENRVRSTEDRVHSTDNPINSKINSRKLSDIIKLPGSFIIRNASIAFLDALPYDKPHVITVDGVNGEVFMNFDENYSKILDLSFAFEGNLNGANDQVIKWIASLNPKTPRLTMSNRFEVSNLDLLDFEPYYDRFSPFVFKSGKFSGTLVFDFNNGNIGSTNEVRFSDLTLFVKPGYENAQMWETNVPDLMRYFTTPSGDIVFDFRLKGDMNNPQFYLGPISKRALASMAIDKVTSYAMDQISKQQGGVTGGVDKTKQAIDFVRGLMNKK